MKEKIILGIDPGIGRMGYGVIRVSGQEMKAIAFGCITTPENKPVGERLLELEKDLSVLIERHKPDKIVVEQLLFSKNVSTGIIVGEARGVILLVAEKARVPVVEYTPPQIKLAVTGDGSADKKRVEEMVVRLLKLTERPKLDDTSDALAIAICGSC